MKFRSIVAVAGMACLLLAPADALAQATVRTLTLTDRSEIADADAVYSALSTWVNDAQACTPRAETCICSFAASVDRVADAYHEAVAKHPAWGQPATGIEYQKTGHGTRAIVMSNVRRELQKCGRN